MPPGGAVGAAKIADHRGTHFGGQKSGIEPLNGVGWIVKEGLSVRGDGREISGAQTGGEQRFIHGRRVAKGNFPRDFSQIRQDRYSLLAYFSNIAAQRLGIRAMLPMNQTRGHLHTRSTNSH